MLKPKVMETESTFACAVSVNREQGAQLLQLPSVRSVLSKTNGVEL